MVRCADCGFLGLRRGDGGLIEADLRFRTERQRDVPHGAGPAFIRTGDQPRIPSAERVDTSFPRCLVRPAVDFRQRAEAIMGGEYPTALEVVTILTEDWDCDRFFRWEPGFTPTEHRDLLSEQARRDREDTRDREMRAREDRRDEKVERLQRDLHRRELWVMGGAVTFAVIVGSILAAVLDGAISRGWEPSWWPF